MIDPLPRRPQGDTAEARFMQASWDKMVSARVQSSSGARINRTTRGFRIESRNPLESSVSVRMLKLRFIDDDYLICRSWDGTTIGLDDINVAKQFKHRCSLTSEKHYTINGAGTNIFIDHNYTYADDTGEPYMEYGTEVAGGLNEWGETVADYGSGGELYQVRLNKVRTVTMTVDGTPITETQRIVPAWLKGDVIFAISARTGVTTGGGAAVVFLDVASSRQWAKTNAI